MNFQEELKLKTAKAEHAMEAYFPVPGNCPESLSQAMGYSLFAGGKRLRPVLLLSACEVFGGEYETALPFACALEMIHTYSLIHDDLPAMDNDDLRRGRPTNHKVFGEDMAILAGDGLLSYAFELMTAACLAQGTTAAIRAMDYIAKGAGVRGMVAGQVEDVRQDGLPMDEDMLEFIHIHKTADMLIGALRAGAVLGGATEDEVTTMEEVGLALGLAFQIRDDILDVTGDETTLGKPIHSDEKNQKTTYATFYGLDGAVEKVEEYSLRAETLLAGLGKDTAFLQTLCRYLTQRND